VNRPVSHGIRVLVELALAAGFLVPVAMAQKPGPAPPPTAPPGRTTNPATTTTTTQPVQSSQDRIAFLMGRVKTSDSTAVPNDAIVERVCNGSVRQQVHAALNGEFSMQLGSQNDSMLDATGDPGSRVAVNNQNPQAGISRQALENCELRASVSGFSSSEIRLVDLAGSLSSVDVGTIVVQRRTKVAGLTVSGSAYNAPKDARKAYEKGLVAEKKGELANAQKYFGKAVEIYPKYVYAWYQLGTVLKKEHEQDAARAAFTRAAGIDTKFLPPYLALALMAYEAENWTSVLELTGHILDLDPLKHVAGYVWDLDPMNYTDAYFYNAVANYKLKKFADAERSGLKAEQVDLPTRFPQLHLLLGEIFARKNDYPIAIAEIQTYLELVPHSKDGDQIREHLAKLEKLNGSVSASEKPVLK
jgi:tetratricopeptide (TPR) repeat protein